MRSRTILTVWEYIKKIEHKHVLLTHLCLTLTFSLICASAYAKVSHKFLPPQLTAISGNPSQLNEVNSITTDRGDLFIAENAGIGARVNEFDTSNSPTIVPVAQFPAPPTPIERLWEGIAVGHVTRERRIYIGGNEIAVYGESSPGNWTFLAKWDGSGTPATTFGRGSGDVGVAVDNSSNFEDWARGDVYMADGPENVVDVLEPNEDATQEVVVAQIEGTQPGKPFKAPIRVAVSEITGDVLVADLYQDAGGEEEDVVDLFAPEAGLPGTYKTLLTLTGLSPSEHFAQITSVAFMGPTSAGSGNILVGGKVFENGVPGRPEVFEFTQEGAFVSKISGGETPTERFTHVSAVAADSVSNSIFVGDRGGVNPSAVDQFSDDVVIPDVKTGTVSKLKLDSVSHTWDATFSGTVNPVDSGTATCWFVWGATELLGARTKCVGTGEDDDPIENGDTAVSVKGEVSGLAPGSIYHERLQAENVNGVNEGEAAENVSFTTPGPRLGDTWSSNISANSVRLHAAIDPNEPALNLRVHPVRYFFEYGTGTNYGSVVAGETIGPGLSDVRVEKERQGLSASTLYHYRVAIVAEVEPEPEEKPGVLTTEMFYGQDQVFTTQGLVAMTGESLSDGRAWELVSPVNKHGGLVLGLNQAGLFKGLTQSSLDGGSLTFVTGSPTEDGIAGNGTFQIQVFARRGGGGWSQNDIATPHSAKTGVKFTPEYQFFSDDLSAGMLLPRGVDGTLLSALASEPTPYVRQNTMCEDIATRDECYLPILNEQDVSSGEKFGAEHAVEFVTATPGGEHVIVRSRVALTTTPTNNEPDLYEWSREKPAADKLQIVSMLPSNEGAGGKEIPSEAGSVNVGSNPADRLAAGPKGLTSDGSRVVWTIADSAETPLYLRDVARGESLRLDVAQVGAKGGLSQAQFQGLSSDGRLVLFTDTAQLTPQASKHGADLYECVIVEEAGNIKCNLSDLTPERSDGSSEVQNQILGSSTNNSYVYFVANGKLGSGIGRGGCGLGLVTSSTCNLFVYHEGTIKLIAVLASEDETDWSENNSISHDLGNLTARVSPDGRFAAFMSSRSLTGYDNRDVVSGEPDQEVYLYDAVADRLVCASCNSSGGRPMGREVRDSSLFASFAEPDGNQYSESSWVAANIVTGDVMGGLGESLYQPRVLFDSGRLVFNSSDALVAGDVNGGEDVYEFEPVGVPTGRFACSTGSVSYSAIAGGCVSLISSGRAIGGAGLMDASASGDDIFFVTAERLVGKDVDTAVDVYNAHVCGSAWDCVGESVSPPACADSESCRAAPVSQPGVFGAPPSATFNGPGNVLGSGEKSTARVKILTRAQKLSRALKACKKKKVRKQRTTCERIARKSYGPPKHVSRSSKSRLKRGANVAGGRGR